MQIETIRLNPCGCGRVPTVEYVRVNEMYVAGCHGMHWGCTGNEAARAWNEANPVSVPPLITLNPCTKCGKAPSMEPRINGVYYRCCKVETFELNEITAINFLNLINPKLQK